MAYRLLIDGKLVDGASTLEVINPATGAIFETCACADEAQLEQAIAAAKRAFPAWASLTQSGIGRESGLEGMKEFTQAKIINLANKMAA